MIPAYAPVPEPRHDVPKCTSCGWIGPWQVAPVLETHHIVITLLLLILFGGGLVYLVIVLLIRSNEANRAKICPRCGARNMHTFVYPDAPSAMPVHPVPHPSATVMAPAGVAVAAAGPSVGVLLNGRRVTSLPLSRGSRFSIGRAPDCSVVVADSMVSAMHAGLLVHSNGDLGIWDEGSTNGTFVNGARLAGEYRLRPGDEVMLGSSNARLTFDHGQVV